MFQAFRNFSSGRQWGRRNERSSSVGPSRLRRSHGVVVMPSLPECCRHSIGLPSRLRRRHGVVGVEDDPPRVPEKKCQPRFEEFEKFSDISAKSVSVLWRCLFFRLFNRLAGERAS